MAPEAPVTQCAAVTTRFPFGLWTTLAEQTCCPSLPLDVVNSAPTAGVPANGCPVCEDEARFRTARTKPSAMSVAAPLAGVTVTMIPKASAATSATRSGDQENQRARPCGRSLSAGGL